MKEILTIDDVYSAIDELITELNMAGHSKLATILYHRMHQVAWTTRSELFEELQNILVDALQSKDIALTDTMRNHIQQIEYIVENYLKSI